MVSITGSTSSLVSFETPTTKGPDWYLLSDDKKHKSFEISRRSIPKEFAHKVWISKHLAPFALNDPADAILPVSRSTDGTWQLAAPADLATSPKAQRHFDQIIRESDFDSAEELWDQGLDYRKKLTKQRFDSELDEFLVLYGAGGGIPAASFVSCSDLPKVPPIVDQTLYWALVDSKQEAQYLVGVLNSSALLASISAYIPEGEFGGRHLHTLPSKAIPRFDPADEVHTRVAKATSTVMQQVEAIRDNPTTAAYFSSSRGLAQRRSKIRQLTSELPAYAEYQAACNALYQV